MEKKKLNKTQKQGKSNIAISLIKSNNTTIDIQKRNEEIQFYLSQIILLANKRGRPANDFIQENKNAA